MSKPNATKNTEAVVADDDYDDDCQFIFPQRLMSILSDESNTEAITWLPHGRAFIIRDRKLFAELVMPKYFPRKSKYSSFTRKLNRWNFVRVSSGPELGAYYHEFFLRDKPQLAAQMFCKNARSKIAMATPTHMESPGVAGAAAAAAAATSAVASASAPTAAAPGPSTNTAAALAAAGMVDPLVLQQKLMGGVDPARMFLTGQGMDPQVRLLLGQQLQQMSMKQQQQQTNNMIGIMENGLSGLAPYQGGSRPLAIQQQIQAQKQQQAHMLQLQQLMALNLRRQQKRRQTSNNFRASAA